MSTITEVTRRTWIASTTGTLALASAESTPIWAIPPGAVARRAVLTSRSVNRHRHQASARPKTRNSADDDQDQHRRAT